MLAGNISVHGADAERRGQRKIRDAVIGRDPLHQFRGQFRIADALADAAELDFDDFTLKVKIKKA